MLKNFYINKRNKGLLKILVGAAVFILLLLVLNTFVSPVKNLVYIISSPMQKAFLRAGESSSLFFGSFMKAGALSRENENLKTENQKLLSQVATLQSIVEGNKAQSDVSEACQNTGFKLIMAGAMGLDNNDILSINKGSADGIAEGMPAINQKNVLFGKVFKVYKNFSQIMLISNKDSVTNVKILNAEEDGLNSEVDGVVKGNGGLTAYLDLVSISNSINPEDVLVTSTVEKSFPKDLLVGKIIQVQKDDQKPFQKASVNLFFDVMSSGNLFVITNYKQEK